MSTTQTMTDECEGRNVAVLEGTDSPSVTNGSGPVVSENGDCVPPEAPSSEYDATHFDLAALTAPDCVPSPAAADRLMDYAFSAARDALSHQEVPVGCVFARAGRLLAAGRNTVNETKNATRHAELNCVDLVYSRCAVSGLSPERIWPEIDVFVTVEPCVMCAAALIRLGVRSVTYGAANQRFGGCGSVLDVPGKMMPSAVRFTQDESRVEPAVALLKDFYKGENPNAPRQQA